MERTQILSDETRQILQQSLVGSDFEGRFGDMSTEELVKQRFEVYYGHTEANLLDFYLRFAK